MDNNIKNFEEFNESWRQWKFRLGLPIYILNGILGNLLKYEPNLNLRYKSLAAKVDMNQSIERGYEIKEEPVKLTLDKFKGTKLYHRLKISGFLNNWNIYHIGNINRNGNRSDDSGTIIVDSSYRKARIFITKDELNKGDKYTGRRINDKYISSDKLDFIVIIAAKITDEHNEIRIERELRKDKEISKDLNKLLKIALKNGTYNMEGKVGRKKMTLIYALVKYNKPKLLKKLIEIIPEDERKSIFSERRYYTFSNEGQVKRDKYDDRTSLPLFDIAKGKVKAMLVKYQDKKSLAKQYNFKDKASGAFKKFNS